LSPDYRYDPYTVYLIGYPDRGASRSLLVTRADALAGQMHRMRNIYGICWAACDGFMGKKMPAPWRM
jgi:hypothetical protein